MPLYHPKQEKESGVSLVELMVSIAISMIIMLAVVTMLSDASRSHMELNKSSQLIENGRFSVYQLQEDIHHSGFYGYFFYDDLAAPVTLPDPCVVNNPASILAAMALPIQGYNAGSLTARPNLTGVGCATTFLTNANLQGGSDILVIRRASTDRLFGVPVANEIYLQSNVSTADIQIGNATTTVPGTVVDGDGVIILPGNEADGDTVSIFQRDGITPADIRKYSVRIYFIAPCSIGNDPVTNGVCTAGDDGVPTLKMLELGVDGGGSTMIIRPVAEGVEYMKLSYGIDNIPTTVNSITGLIGDGVPDSYSTSPTLAQWRSVVSVKINLLIRAPQVTAGHLDNKRYSLGGIAVGPLNDNFKRHVFSTEVRLLNLAGPREVP
jgi:type IV pilus assembly protein PilW